MADLLYQSDLHHVDFPYREVDNVVGDQNSLVLGNRDNAGRGCCQSRGDSWESCHNKARGSMHVDPNGGVRI